MRKDLIVAVLCTFCLTVTLFTIIPTRSQTEVQYDPWYDLNDDGKIDVLDVVLVTNKYGTTGTPINKTELLLELQIKINSLNASLSELQSKVNALEEKSNHVKTIRFYEPNETMVNDPYTWNTSAVFTWIPNNPDNNAIVSCILFFEVKYGGEEGWKTQAYYELEINGYSWQWKHNEYPRGYFLSPIHDVPINEFNYLNGFTRGFQPNQPSYTIVFRINYGPIWVRNIHVILTVIDGLSIS